MRIAAIGFKSYNIIYKKARRRRLRKTGMEAKAILINITITNPKKPKPVCLQLQVYPQSGRNFVTEINTGTDLLDPGSWQIGDTMTVKYNPANTNELIIIGK